MSTSEIKSAAELKELLKTSTAKRIAQVVAKSIFHYEQTGDPSQVSLVQDLLPYLDWEKYPTAHEWAGEVTIESQKDKEFLSNLFKKIQSDSLKDLVEMTHVNYDGE
jgi:hypothetical protein